MTPTIGSIWLTETTTAVLDAYGTDHTGAVWVHLTCDSPNIRREWPLGDEWSRVEDDPS